VDRTARALIESHLKREADVTQSHHRWWPVLTIIEGRQDLRELAAKCSGKGQEASFELA
jgi:hypothetical protein